MRTIKHNTISILAVGLLAGSAVGVAAQDEVDPMAPSTFTTEPIGEPEVTADPETGLGTLVAPYEATDPRASGTIDLQPPARALYTAPTIAKVPPLFERIRVSDSNGGETVVQQIKVMP